MRNDRIDLMVLVQDCLAAKHEVTWALIVDTLIAKGYHRCDKDEREKMDTEDRAADEIATMRLRAKTLRETADHYWELAKEQEVGSEEREHYYGNSVELHVIAGEYFGLTARRAAELGRSE